MHESKSEVAQSCLTLCDPMDCSLPGSSIHGIFQARVLEWVAISFSRGSSRPGDETCVSLIVGRCFYHLSHQGSPILNKTEHTQNRASTPVTGRWAGQIIAAWVTWQGPTLFFIFIFLKFYFIFKFYIIVLVLPNIKMNPPQVYMWGSHFKEGIGKLQCLQRILQNLQCTKQLEAFLQGVNLQSVMWNLSERGR